jgi:hypothetical protein
LRFGDPRVMAPAGTLCNTLLAASSRITNKSLRALMTALPHALTLPGQMTYDLRRLRMAGLIARIEHTNRYTLTPDGINMAVFYTKVHNRLLRPLMATSRPQAPPELRRALRVGGNHSGGDHLVIRSVIGERCLAGLGGLFQVPVVGGADGFFAGAEGCCEGGGVGVGQAADFAHLQAPEPADRHIWSGQFRESCLGEPGQDAQRLEALPEHSLIDKVAGCYTGIDGERGQPVWSW